MLSNTVTASSSLENGPASADPTLLTNSNSYTSALSWFGSAAKAVKSRIIPSSMSTGTSYASAGSALFGARLIFDYGVGYYYPDPNDTPEWCNQVKFGLSLAAIGFNVLTVLHTRWPATFREYKKSFGNKDQPTAQPKAKVNEISDNKPVAIRVDTSDSATEEKTSPQAASKVSLTSPPLSAIILPDSSLFPLNTPDNSKEKKAEQEEKVEAPASGWSWIKRPLYIGTFGFGLGSLFFASLNRYLSGVTLNEFIAGLKTNAPSTAAMDAMYGAAAFAVFCRFVTGYAFSIPLTKKTAAKFSRWVIGEGVESRRADVISYLPAFGLSFLNIVGNAFIAHYSTKLTLLKIPFVRDYNLFVETTAAVATTTSLANSMLSQLPAVRRLLENWWYKKPDKSPEIRELDKLNNTTFKVYDKAVYTAGFGDAIMQGSTAAISVIDTCNDKFGVDKYNLPLFIFAMACWVSFTAVEYASSTCRGWRDTKINEVYDLLATRGLVPELNNAEEATPVQAQNNDLNQSLLTEDEQAEEKSADEIPDSPALPIRKSSSASSLQGLSLFVPAPRSRPTSPTVSPTKLSPRRSPVQAPISAREENDSDSDNDSVLGTNIAFSLS